jgi:hypothetical protein
LHSRHGYLPLDTLAGLGCQLLHHQPAQPGLQLPSRTTPLCCSPGHPSSSTLSSLAFPFPLSFPPLCSTYSIVALPIHWVFFAFHHPHSTYTNTSYLVSYLVSNPLPHIDCRLHRRIPAPRYYVQHLHTKTLCPPAARASSFELPWIWAQLGPNIVAIHLHRLSFPFPSSVAARCIPGRDLRIASHRIQSDYTKPRVRIANLWPIDCASLSRKHNPRTSNPPPSIVATLPCRAHGFSNLITTGRSTYNIFPALLGV